MNTARPRDRATQPAAWRPWLIWGLGALLFCYGFFQRVAPSVMIDPLMRDLAVGGALLGNLSALYFYVYAAVQIPGGLLHDRFGPRVVIALGGVICGAGSILFSFAADLTLAYLGRFMIGAGAATCFIGTLLLATRWFPPQRFALLSGLTMMAGMVGGIFGQAPLAALVDAHGWRPLMFWAGVFGLVLGVLIWLVVRDRPAADPDAPPEAPLDRAAFWTGLGQVLTTPANLLVAYAVFALSAPMLAFAGLWGVAWLMQTEAMTRPEAAATCSLLLIGFALGAPLCGALSDRLGRRQEILAFGAVLALGFLCLLIYWPQPPAPARQALFLVTGLSLGGMVGGFALIRDINRPNVVGTAYGFLNGCAVGAGAVFQPLIGWLLDLRWRGEMLEGAPVYDAEAYRFAFTVMILFLASGLVAALALGRSLRRLRQATT